MGEFAGWDMPLSYADGGTVAEHTAVRQQVGIFDVSHLGKLRVSGPGAADFINATLSADIHRIAPGSAQYTMCCNDTGGVIDDLIVYFVSEEELFLIPNAANTAAVEDALQAAAPAQITITDQQREFGVIAVQGPLAEQVVAALGLPTELDYMGWVDAPYAGGTIRVCRTGYTGERGFELLPVWDVTAELWDQLMAIITPLGGRPAGLAARDTLRSEMGYPLHGQDLSPDISPLEAGASWAVGWKKSAFFGRDALLAQKEAGPTRRLRGLKATGRGIPRPGQQVRNAAGDTVGITTTGTFSPTLGHGIALAMIDTAADIGEGDELIIDVRGRALPTIVTKPPFVPSHVR